jgi:hypothetical protein
MKFPSTTWFEALREQADDKRDRFRSLGFVDASVGIKVESDNGGAAGGFVLEFSGYGCKQVRQSSDPASEADFVLVGPYDVWQEMLENIQSNGEPDLDHTLNVLTLPGVPLKVEAEDQLKEDLFYRYNQTFQEFFNGAAELETEFE